MLRSTDRSLEVPLEGAIAPSKREENWYDRRVAALRNQAGPFWLHQAKPDTRDHGYWTAATVRMQLPETLSRRSTKIEGSYNAELVSRQSGTPEANVVIFLRHTLLYTSRFCESGDFSFDFKLPRTLRARPKLVILSENILFLREINLGAGCRELAFKLKHVRIGDTAIFDCIAA